MALTDALTLEKTNTRHIYLYYYKVGAWSCCGCSAKLLHLLYPNIYYSEKPVSGWGDACPVTIIDLMTLEHLIDNFPPKERSEERMVFEIPEGWLLYLH